MQFLSLIRNDIKSRFAGSKLGFFWAFFSPAVTIGIYWFVYRVALQGQDMGGIPYLHFLVTGILPWLFFAEGLTSCTSVFRDYQFLVCNLKFPVIRLPFIRVFATFLLHIGFLILAYLLLTLWGVPMRVGQLQIIFWMAGGFCLTLALGRIFALWNACSRDVGYGLNVAIQLGFWLTPVFWSPDSLPDWLSRISVWNPVATLVEGYRTGLLFGTLPEFSHVLIFWGEVLVLYGIGTLLMDKLLPTIADRL